MATDFALIGHQDSWSAAQAVLRVLRGKERAALSEQEVREILPWIPPRPICSVAVDSVNGTRAQGFYIDCFLPPDQLEPQYLRTNLARVKDAASCAIRLGAKIVSLGGFSSILIEGNFDRLPSGGETVFTTGNTLTVSFIVRGIKRMCTRERRDLADAKVLIIGATGDVGSGCARCLAPFVKRLLLRARNKERLSALAAQLRGDGCQVNLAWDAEPFDCAADIVICAASLPSPTFVLNGIVPDAIVCDAGYPKNLASLTGRRVKLFHGGMGQVTGDLRLSPDLNGILNRHPFPNVAHGCLLEGMALALEKRFEPFSQGRGFITRQRVADIETIADRHGICPAPLFNQAGPLEAPLMEEHGAHALAS
jgi:predicted amino acid dehydrogenase